MNSHPTKRSPAPTARSSGATLRSATTTMHPKPRVSSSSPVPLDPDQCCSDTHASRVGVDHSADGHVHRDPHTRSVVGTSSTDQGEAESQAHDVGGPGQPSPTRPAAIHSVTGDGWLELRIWAEMFHDAQVARISATNRAERGGVDPDLYAGYLATLAAAEHECGLALRRTYRRVTPPAVVAWQKATVGIGDHLLARLLGHLGHPVWATPHHWEGTGSTRILVTDPPYERTVGQLWQYCGHGRPERKRKGMTADELAAQGSPNLKMLVHLIAESCMKQRHSPYRLVYERARLDTVDKLHTVECVRCGPSGKPAAEGTPWSLGHQNGHALRIVGKEILRDLWIICKETT